MRMHLWVGFFMIRKVGQREFAICYDANGEVFEDGFATFAEACLRFESMKPVDRMLVSGVGPYLNTDSVFMEGTANGRQFQDKPGLGDYYKKIAQAHGQDVVGKKYISQLARFPGDPEAFISSRGDVQKVLEQRGWGSEGAVRIKKRPIDVEPPPAVDVADDIVHRETQNDLDGQTITVKKYKEKFADKKAALTPPWKKR